MSRHPDKRRRGLPRTALAVLAIGLGLASGCARDASPDARWPAGSLVSADRAALLRVLAPFERIEHTPLARAARDLARALPECDRIEARADRPEALAGALRCADPDGPLRDLHAWRGGNAAVLALPVSEAGAPRLLLRVREQAEGLVMSARWPRPGDGSPLASLLPGTAPAGPAVLAATDRVAHVRVLSDGLDPLALVPAGSQADELFRLRRGLAAAFLDGSWEVAVYVPAAGARMPRIAVALGVRLRTAADAALDRLLTDVEASWPVRRARLPVAGLSAACLPGLALLPELAPCGVATERALVLAWNADSLRHALATGPGAEPLADAAGRAVLDLERLHRADLLLAALDAPGAVAPVQRWPWRRLVAHADRRGDAVALEVRLDPAAGMP